MASLDMLDVGSLGQSNDLWPIDMNDFIDWDATTTNAAGIEATYADIHKSIDAAFHSISHQKAPTLDHVRQQNQRVYERLTGLEQDVVRRTPPSSRADSLVSDISSGSSPGSDSGIQQSAHRHSRQYSRQYSRQASVTSMPYAAIQSTENMYNGTNPSTPIPAAAHPTPVSYMQTPQSMRYVESPTPSVATSDRNSLKRRKICPSERTPSVTSSHSRKSSDVMSMNSQKSGAEGRSQRLAQKMLQIGNPDSVARLDDFQQQLQTPQPRPATNSLSPRYGFPNIAQVGNGTEFLRMLPNLAMAIECNIFGEQNHRIHKRIALAHFYQAYTLAQDNPETFLSWCNDQHLRRSSLLPKGGYKSIVQHRFADLMFPHRTMPSTDPKKNDNLKAHIGKIQTWRKNGKQWAKMILRFGYGILLLVPTSLTDEDLRVAHDEDIAYILDQLDARRYLFSDALIRANELLRRHFFAEQQAAQQIDITNACDNVDWNEFFQSVQ